MVVDHGLLYCDGATFTPVQRLARDRCSDYDCEPGCAGLFVARWIARFTDMKYKLPAES